MSRTQPPWGSWLSKVNNAIVSCYHARTGEPHFFAQRLEGVGGIYASPVGADGRIYFVGHRGTAQVIRNSSQLDVLATNRLDDEFDATPAIVGNQIFLKDSRYLYCIGVTP